MVEVPFVRSVNQIDCETYIDTFLVTVTIDAAAVRVNSLAHDVDQCTATNRNSAGSRLGADQLNAIECQMQGLNRSVAVFELHTGSAGAKFVAPNLRNLTRELILESRKRGADEPSHVAL